MANVMSQRIERAASDSTLLELDKAGVILGFLVGLIAMLAYQRQDRRFQAGKAEIQTRPVDHRPGEFERAVTALQSQLGQLRAFAQGLEDIVNARACLPVWPHGHGLISHGHVGPLALGPGRTAA